MTAMYPQRNDGPLIAGILVAVLLVIGGGVFFASRVADDDAEAQATAEAAPDAANDTSTTTTDVRSDAEVDALLADARAARVAGDPLTAVSFANRALAIDPIHPEALYLKGEALLELGRADEAIEALSFAVAGDPEKARYHAALGRAYLANDEPESAVMVLEEATALAPEDPTIREHLELALDERNRASEIRG